MHFIYIIEVNCYSDFVWNLHACICRDTLSTVLESLFYCKHVSCVMCSLSITFVKSTFCTQKYCYKTNLCMILYSYAHLYWRGRGAFTIVIFIKSIIPYQYIRKIVKITLLLTIMWITLLYFTSFILLHYTTPSTAIGRKKKFDSIWFWWYFYCLKEGGLNSNI